MLGESKVALLDHNDQAEKTAVKKRKVSTYYKFYGSTLMDQLCRTNPRCSWRNMQFTASLQPPSTVEICANGVH